MPKTDTEKKLDKQTLKSLCELASTESDRKLIQSAATWDMSGKKAQASIWYGNHSQKLNQLKEAIANYQEIHEEIMKLANLEETALLRSMGVADEVESETETSEDESDLDSSSDDEQCCCKSEAKTIISEEDTQTNKNLGFNPKSLSKHVAVNIAPSNDTLLLWLRENIFNWSSFFQDVTQYLKDYSSDVLHHVLLNFTEFLSDSNLNEEKKLVEET